jgi:hypothetical protein
VKTAIIIIIICNKLELAIQMLKNITKDSKKL